MKNLLRKFHIGGSQEEGSEGSRASSGNLKHRLSASESTSSSTGDQKPLSGLSGFWNVARNTLHPPSGGDQSVSEGGSSKYRADADLASESKTQEDWSSDLRLEVASPVDSSIAQESVSDAKDERVTEPSDQALSLEDEEYQVQVAMALSVNYDPEAAQIETAKQISLGSFPTLRNTTAEVVAYQYWNKNILNYDDKTVDGFYDIYGTAPDLASETMPALVDLQETPVSASMTLEVVLVNRATDLELVNIEQEAVSLAVSCRVGTVGLQKSGLIQRIADLVAGHMGGQVVDADMLLKSWRTKSVELGLSLGSIVLPLGRLQIGLVRHRALLFKVLADTIGIPCKLLKGRHYTGSHEGAMNVIKFDDGREFIIDLMGTPGALIPSDATGPISSLKTGAAEYSEPPIGKDASGTGGVSEEFVPGAGIDHPDVQNTVPDNMQSQEEKHFERYQSEPGELQGLTNVPARFAVARPGHPFSHSLRRSPSWTEGIGSPAVRDMKVKDVSQYMMDVAKENPKLAQRLHDVLLESGVRAPPDLFNEISPKQLQAQVSEEKKFLEDKEEGKVAKGIAVLRKEKSNVDPGLPPGPAHLSYSSSSVGISKDRLQRLNSVEGLGYRRPLEPSHSNTSPNLSPSSPTSTGVVAPQSSSPVSPGAAVQSVVQEGLPPEIIKHVPVAAAAAATAAVVASSMVVAATKSDYVTDPTLEVPVAAAATATAAVVVATSAVVGRRRDILEALYDIKSEANAEKGAHEISNRRHDEADIGVKSAVDSESEGIRDGEGTGVDSWAEGDRVSDKSTGSVSARSDAVLDDVAEFEIRWEEIKIGERIGLGSYGEVYRGDWHGTEVAVKKFLNQDISGDALEEFRSEVRLMRRMRHPNVVLFMGAVMRAPNLSIVTEFLPRGSLYRLIHRPNNQLDERKRMRMALDVARGMNYLHNSTPMIVHRDLKSPNLLVDKNWVVKVCDFGLSRMKHNTFLSSKSTAGTPEWMAPEVLRNEPSNEKSDVYSFGVILWELATLQQPWFGMNSMQVVGAVGFQYRCLDIPEDMDPLVAEIIRKCWRSDPGARPSFEEIMATLRPLLKPLTANRSSESGKRGSLLKPAQSQGKASAVPLSDDPSEGQDAAAA